MIDGAGVGDGGKSKYVHTRAPKTQNSIGKQMPGKKTQNRPPTAKKKGRKPGRPNEDARLDKRRTDVAARLLAGERQSSIAKSYNVNPSTITRDVQVIMEEMREERLRMATHYVSIEQARLDVLQQQFWLNALAGDPKAGELALKIMERRAKLLGLDKSAELTVMTAGRVEIGQAVAILPDNDRGDPKPE